MFVSNGDWKKPFASSAIHIRWMKTQSVDYDGDPPLHALVSATLLEIGAQTFFKDDKHIFVLILVVLQVATTADI